MPKYMYIMELGFIKYRLQVKKKVLLIKPSKIKKGALLVPNQNFSWLNYNYIYLWFSERHIKT
jgi:hypothetical protein